MGVVSAGMHIAVFRLERHICHLTDGQSITRCVDVPQNYSLEIAQLGRCIALGEQPHVSADFTLATARTLDKALAAIGYETGA